MQEIKVLSADDIPHVLKLSKSIFAPLLQNLHKDDDETVWQENYQNNGLLLGAYVEEELAGFIFFYEKESGTKSIHCWMDGVDEKFRGKGILKALMQTGLQLLKDKGYNEITVNTFPKQFPEMNAYLKKYGFIKYKEETLKNHGELDKKAFFRKKIDY